MTSKSPRAPAPLPSPVAGGEHAHWDGLRLTLVRFFEGPPIGKYGVFQGVVFTAYKMLAGRAVVEKGGVRVNATRGDWVLCLPGERFQDFTDTARIVSVHLLVQSAGNAAAWEGGPVLILKDRPAESAGLNTSLAALRRTAVISRLETSGRICPMGEAATFVEALELQEALAGFSRRLMTAMEPLGMRFDAPPIHDQRVRESHQRLGTASLREGFSRTKLARECALSATQLDRLWRDELGQTPAQFWHARRLQTACVLLQGEAHSIKEVAYETGFVHPSQFSFWFTRNMNESPRSFRRRHARG